MTDVCRLLTPPPPGPPPCPTLGRISMMTGTMDQGRTQGCQVSQTDDGVMVVNQSGASKSGFRVYDMMALFILIPGGDTRGYSDDEEEEEEEDGEYMDQETVEQFEDRVLNKRAAKV